ncbi:MAG: RluA family pseudouridine synthase [Planctomycetes bacterium]|nr:RluA family pseudouridine synthase [Planctomycetota bacterium]
MVMKRYVASALDTRKSLVESLHDRLGLPWQQARRLVCEGRVRLDGRPCFDYTRCLRRGQQVGVDVRRGAGCQPARQRQAGSLPHGGGPIVRFADAHIVIVDKPAGLTTVRHAGEAAAFGARGRRYLPATLADLLPSLLPEERGSKHSRVRAVHRLDKETSGLVVFARTAEAERNLGRQFRAHTIERHYLAIVRGQAVEGTIESWLVRDRGDGRRGSCPKSGEGQHAITHVRVLERLGEYTLVECRLETGRTHQVRIHLGEAATPLCGERIYDRPPNGRPLPDGSGATRVALHAASLGFDHPATGKRVRSFSPLPKDLKALLDRLRRPPH